MGVCSRFGLTIDGGQLLDHSNMITVALLLTMSGDNSMVSGGDTSPLSAPRSIDHCSYMPMGYMFLDPLHCTALGVVSRTFAVVSEGWMCPGVWSGSAKPLTC